MNYGFVIDNRRCIGCHACTVACKSEHEVPIGVNRTHVKYVEKGIFPNNTREFSVHRCNHCEDAPCVTICPTRALYTRADGIVDFDNDRCIGCKSCMQACPYDALYIDPEQHTAAKCNYCTHRVDRGYEPACVVVCPVEAIVSGDLDDPYSKIAKLVAEEPVTVRKPEKNTSPNLFYVESGQAMLDPAASPPAASTVWTEQKGGVGHFAEDQSGRFKSNPAAREKGSGGGRRVYDVPSKGLLWGWEVPAYIVTKAIAVGAFSFIWIMDWLGKPLSHGQVNINLATSLFFLMATAAFLVKDLDRPDRFLYVLLRPNWSSWLVRGAFVITLFGALVSLALVLNLMNRPLGWIALPGIPLAVLGAVYTAFLLAQAKARDAWQSPLVPVHMLLHGAMAGAAVTLLAVPESTALTGRLLCWGFGLNMGFLLAELVTPHGSVDAQRCADLMKTGVYGRLFLAVLVLGNLLPLGLLLLFQNHPVALAAAVSFTLAGLFASESLRVRLPQLIPLH